MLNYLTTHLLTYTKQLRRDDRGATMVEYGLLVALIAVVVVPALLILGPAIFNLFDGVAGNVGPAAP
jgi:pilus assembly protein Flp/PilA